MNTVPYFPVLDGQGDDAKPPKKAASGQGQPPRKAAGQGKPPKNNNEQAQTADIVQEIQETLRRMCENTLYSIVCFPNRSTFKF